MGRVTGRDRQQSQREGWAFRPNRGRWQSGKDFSGGGRRNLNQNRSFNAGHQQHSARGEQAHYKGAHQDKNQEWPASTVHRHEHATSSRSSVQSKQTEGSTADKGTSSVPGGRKKKAPSLDDLISQAVEKVMQMDTVSGAENSDHASDQVPVDSGQMGSAQDGDADTKTKSRQSRWDVGPADSSPQALIITVPPACPKGSAAQATATHAPHKRSSAQAAATHAWTKGSISQATATHTPHKGSIAQATIQASPKGSMSQAAATHIPSRGSVAQASSTHARPRGSNTKAKTDHAPNKGSFAQATSTHTPPKWSTAQATSTHTSPKGSVAQTTSTHDPPRGSVAPVTSTHAPPKVSVAKGPTAHVLSQTAVVKIHPANTAPKELIVSTPPAATPPKGLVTKVPPAETTLKGSVVNIHPAKSIPKGLVTHTPPANIPPKGSVTNMPAANTPPKGLVANTPPANTPPRRLVANTPTANTPPKGLVASTSPANIPPKGLVASTPSANTPPKGLVANTPSANTPPKGLVASFSPADTPPKGQAANIPPALPTGSVTKALSVQASQKWPVKTPVSKTPSTDTCPPKSVARDKSGQLPSKQTEGSARDSLQKHHGRDDIQRQEYSNNQTAAEVPQAQRLLAFPGSGSHLVSDRSSSQVKGDFGSVAERLLNLSGSLEPAKQDPEVAISELTKKLKSLTDALPTPSDDALAALTPLPDPVCSSTPNIDNSSEEKLAALKTRHKRKKNNTVVPISNLTSVFRAVVDSPAVLAWKEETDECSSNDSTVMDLGHVAEPETKENFAGQIVGEDNDGKDKRQTCQEETPKKSEEEAACTAVFKKKVKRLPKPLIPEEMDKKDTGSDHAEKILEHISPVTPQTTTLLVNAPPKEKRGEISACMPAKGVITAQMSTAFVNTAPKEKMVGDTHGPAKDVITCQISTAFMNTAPKEKTGEIAQGKPALGAIPAQKTTTLANTSPKEKTAGKNVPPESAQGVIPSQKTIFVNTPSKEKTEGEIAPCEPAQGVIAPQMTTALLNTPSKDKMAGKTFPLGPAQSVITSHKTMSVTTPSKGETVGETCQREPFQGVISSQMATMSQDIPPKQKTPKPAGVAVTSQMTTLVNTPSLEKTVGETFLHEPVQDGASPQMTTLLKTPSKEKTAAKTFPPEPAGAAVTSQMTKLVNTPSKEKTVGETFPFEPVQDVASPKVTLLKTPPKEKTAAKNVPPEPAQGVITSQKTILVNTPSKEKVAEETFPCELVQDVTPQMTSAFVNTSPKEKTVGKTFPLKSAQDVVPQMTTASVNTPPKEKTEGKICPLEPAEGAAPVKPSSVRRRVWIKTKHTASGQVSPGRMIKSSGTPVTQSKTDRRFVKIKSPKESFKLVYSKDCSQDTGAGSNTHGKREGQGTKISPEQGKMHTDSALDIVAASPIKGQPQPVDLNFSSFFPHSQAEERSIVKSLADKCSEITPDPHSRAVSHESVSRLAETEMRVSTQTATPSTQCELKCVDAVEQTEVGSIQTDSDLKSPSKEPSPALAEQQCDREVNSDLPGLEDISPNGSFVFEDNDLEELPMMTQGDSAEDSPGKEINTSQRSLVSLDLSESADSSKASKTADERKTSKDEAQPTSGQSTLLSENLERQVARRQSRGAAAKRPRKGSITNLNQRDKLKALFSVRRRGSVKQTARPDCSATGLTSLTRNDDTPAAKVVTSPTFDLQHQDVKKVGGNAKPVTLPDSNSQEKYELALLLSTAVKRCEGLESDKTALNKPGALLSSATVETGKAVSVEPAASVSTVMAGYAVSSSTQQAASLTGSGSANPVLMEADTSSGTAMEGCDEPGSGENGSPLTASAEKNEVLPAAGAQSVPDGNVDHVFMENTPVSACMLACEKPISEGVDYPETRTRSGELEKGKLREPTVPLNIDVQSSTEVMSVSGGNATSMNRDRSSAHTAEQLSCSSDNISLSQEPVTANAGQGHSQMNTHSQLSSLTSKTSQGEEYIDDDDILRDIDSCLESSDTFLVDGSKPAGADVNSIEGVAAMSTSRENTVDLYANVTHRVKEQTSTLNLNGEDLLEAVETVSQVDPKNTGPSSSSARPESSSKKTADGSLPQGNICLHAAPDSNDCSKPNPPCKASDSDTCETNTDSVFSVAGHGADPPRSGADQPRQDVCQTVNFTITTTPEDVQQKKTTLVPVKSLGQSKHPPQPSVRLEQDPSGMTEVSISVDIIDSKAEDSQEEDASSVTNCSVGKTEHPDSAQAGDQLTRSPMETGDGEDFVTTYVTLNVPREKSLEICLEPMLQAGHLSGDKDIEIEVMAGKSGSAGAVRVVDSGCSHPNTTACGVHTVLAGTDSVETNQRQEKHSTLGKASIIAESCAAQNKTKLQSLSCNTSQAAEKGESLKLGLQERSSEKPTLPGNKLSDPGPLNSESSKVINAGSKVESCVTRENDTSESSETTQKHQTPVRTATKVTPGHSPTSPPLLTRCDQDNTSPNMTGSPPLLEPQSTPGTPKQHRPPIPLLSPGSEQGLIQNCPTKNMTGVVVNGPDVVVGMSSSNQDACGTVSSSPSEPACGMSGDWNGSVENVVYTTENGDGSLQNILVTGEDDGSGNKGLVGRGDGSIDNVVGSRDGDGSGESVGDTSAAPELPALEGQSCSNPDLSSAPDAEEEPTTSAPSPDSPVMASSAFSDVDGNVFAHFLLVHCFCCQLV